MCGQVDRRNSSDYNIRERRLKRRKAVLFLWGKVCGFWDWVKCLTFKKFIILYCLGYVTFYAETTRRYYINLGLPIPESHHDTIVTIFLGQLALTAVSSLGSRVVEYAQAKFGENDDDDINYG